MYIYNIAVCYKDRAGGRLVTQVGYINADDFIVVLPKT